MPRIVTVGAAQLRPIALKESRVEVVVPVEEPELRAELRAVLDAQLAPNRNAWDMNADGVYVQSHPEAKPVQQTIVEHTEKRAKEATRLRKRRPRGFAKRLGA